jgi:hypothetical protein
MIARETIMEMRRELIAIDRADAGKLTAGGAGADRDRQAVEPKIGSLLSRQREIAGQLRSMLEP